MNQYEAMYILDTQLEEAARQDLVVRFSAVVTSNGGTIDRIDEWGKRRLAYSINYKTEGYYVLMYVSAPSALPKELERNLQISDSVLRYLVTRFEGALPPKREPLKPFVPGAPVAPRVEAAPVEAAAAPVEAVPAEAATAPVEAATAPVEVVAEATAEPEPKADPVTEV